MCTEIVSHSIIKVEENKRKAAFRNPERTDYEVSQVDGCLIEAGVRCDNLVSRRDDHSVLVELKGGDVAHACVQLFAAADHHNVQPLLKEKLGFLVVCRKFPRFDTSVRKAKDRAARKYKAGFHVVCNKGEFDISRVTAIDGPH